VHRALRRSGLPFGAKAAEPKSMEEYPFHHDAKNSKIFWDVRKGLIPIVGAAREVRAAGPLALAQSAVLWCWGRGPRAAALALALHGRAPGLACVRAPPQPPDAPLPPSPAQVGTSMLIEDVACPTDKLADMMIDLIDMFQRFGYHDASCFGHALEGNLHLVFAQVCARVGCVTSGVPAVYLERGAPLGLARIAALQPLLEWPCMHRAGCRPAA
jgi:FAD/FMN-containing dehydrogenase